MGFHFFIDAPRQLPYSTGAANKAAAYGQTSLLFLQAKIWMATLRFMRKIYDWTLQQAEKRSAPYVLFAVSFAEASFFPLPPDILLLPMAFAKRQKALVYAAICTMGSVLGGLFGYMIGAFFFATIGQALIDAYHLEIAFKNFHDGFEKWGVAIILAKGLTPIPFKLVTIASGVAGMSLISFVLACTVTRAARFFLVAWLAQKFGEPIRKFIEKHLTWVSLAVLLVIIFGFILVLN